MKADARSSATTRFWRTVIVVGLAAFVLGTTQPNILAAASGISTGTYGILLDYRGFVTAVLPGLPAARAGIQVGDQIEPVSFDDRVTVVESNISVPGTRVQVVVRHGNQTRTVQLVSVRSSQSAALLQSVIKRLTALAFVLTGAILLLLRPSRMTWGLFLFALSSNGLAGALYFHIFGAQVYTPIEFLLQIIYAIGVLGLWIFAARFPNDDAPGWRRGFDRAAPWLAVPLAATAYPLWHYLFTGQYGGQAGYIYSTYFSVIIESIGVLILVLNYFQERGAARQRIKWVVTGFAVGYIADGAIAFLANPHVHLWPAALQPGISPDILYAAWIVTPISIAYAVLRHHVIDVRFAVSRAIVYAVLTSVVVAAFALIDWFFTKKMSAAQLGAIADICVALLFGFSFNTIHRRVDSFVDGVLFRHRHLAEKRIGLAASALPHAASFRAASELLAAEPMHALELTSGAVFLRTEDESFQRVFSIAWDDSCTSRLASDDTLIARLKASQESLALYGLYWPAIEHCPQGAKAPVLAVPVFIRSQLAALLLLGPHISGEAFDPDELRVLSALGLGASVAFDHLEAEQRRVENETLRRQLEQVSRVPAVSGVATA